MLLCPIADKNQSPVAQAVAVLMSRMEDLLKQCRDETAEVDMGKMELEVQQAVNQAGLSCMEMLLESLNPGKQVLECEGETMRLVLASSNRYVTRFGLARVRCDLYRSVRNGSTVCPLEGRAGIMGGLWTPGAARLMALMMAGSTLRESKKLCEEIGMEVSTSSLGRLLPLLSGAWEADRLKHEEVLRALQTVPPEAAVMCVSVDGVMAPMREKAASRQLKREAAGKHASGPAGYSEIGCGTISLHESAGERLATIYQARMPESKKTTLAEEITAEVLDLQQLRPELTRVYLSDGAPVNWQIAAATEAAVRLQYECAGLDYKPAVEIVDYFHANGHLKKACDAIYGEGTVKGKAQFDILRIKLKELDGGVDTIINFLRYRHQQARCGRRAIETELNYFRRQRKRMDYARYSRANLPIGSGVVEAACKTIVTERMKRSGMAWSMEGGQAILTLRTWIRSNRFDQAWEILTKRFKPYSQQDETYAEPRLQLAA